MASPGSPTPASRPSMTIHRAAALQILSALALSVAFTALPVRAQVVKTATIYPTNTTSTSQFGYAIAASGNRVLVGAPFENGITSQTGAAYVHERQSDGSWAFAAKLTASDAAAFDTLGQSVALAGDVAIVGAPNTNTGPTSNTGSAYVFERQPNGTWLQVAKLVAPDGAAEDVLGMSVALSPSGTVAAVGAPWDDLPGQLNAGSVSLFVRTGPGTWTFLAKITAPDSAANDDFGRSVAVTETELLVGADLDDDMGLESGSVYVYAGGWAYQGKLLAADGASGDVFGWSLSRDGERFVVGARRKNSVRGAAYVFDRIAGTWTQSAKLLASDADANDEFGTSVGLSGDRVVVGAPLQESGFFPAVPQNHGQAYVFVRQPNGTWPQVAAIAPPLLLTSGIFGQSVAISGARLAIGGPRYETTAGAAYLHRDLAGALASFGTGTPGCTGTETLSGNLPPEIGMAAFTISCSAAPPSSLGLGLVSNVADFAGSDPFGISVLLHVDLLTATEVISLDIVSNGSGVGSVPVPIPNNPLLVGSVYYLQALWAWTSCTPTTYGLSTSRGLSLTVLGP